MEAFYPEIRTVHIAAVTLSGLLFFTRAVAVNVFGASWTMAAPIRYLSYTIDTIESLRAELAKVTGLLEELSYRIDAAEKRQRDFYVDLDNRLRKLEQPTGDAPAAEVKPADPAQETRDYEAALAAVKSAKYEEALSAFGTFVKNHPSSGLLASAYFWSGYCLMQTRKPAKAAEMYGKLVATWPEDSRAPDALAAQAAALEAAGDKAGAKKALETLHQKYPDSEAAKSQRTARKK